MTLTRLTAPTWPQMIRDACWLWLRLAADEKDAGLLQRGKIVYAIDSSVASLYSEPPRNANHAQMLGLLHDDVLPDFAYVLGQLCLRRAQSARGFILLPGHDEEFLRVFRAVQRKRADHHGTRSPPKLETLLNSGLLRQNAMEIEKRITSIPVSDAANFIAGKFEILVGMLLDPKFDIARWYDFILRSSIKAATDPALRLPAPDPRAPEFVRDSLRWFDAIRAQKSQNTSALRIEDDVEAMTTLGWMNQQLEARKDERRIVLLTLDTSLQTAALKNPLLAGADAIRDPRQFVRELPSTIGRFLETHEHEANYGVAEWLRILLSPFSSAGTLQSDRIRDMAVKPLDDKIWNRIGTLFRFHHGDTDNTRLSNAQDEWRKFIRLGINRYAIEHMQADPRMAELARLIEKGDVFGLQIALTEYVVKTTSDASVSSLIAGLYVSLGSRTKSHKAETTVYRMPVAVWSPDPEQRNQYIKFMDIAVGSKNLNSLRPIEQLFEKYRVHLYYGVYFAAIGDWEATETLARTALGIADASPQSGSDPNFRGTEAAYLLVAASRHRVRQPEDFVRAVDALIHAERLEAGNGSSAYKARLLVERVAFNLMQKFATKLLGNHWEKSPDLKMSDEDMLAALLKALGLISENPDPLFKQIVQKQIYCNIIIIGMYEFL